MRASTTRAAGIVLVMMTAGCGHTTSAPELAAALTTSDAGPAAAPSDISAGEATTALPGQENAPEPTPDVDTGSQPSARPGGDPSTSAPQRRLPPSGPTATSPPADSGPAAGPGPASSAPPRPGPGGSVPTARCNGQPVHLGTVGALSGPLGEAIRPGVRMIQAWTADVNARGGLACHEVKHIIGDDGSDPARHRALIRQFVEQNNVIAFLFNASPIVGESSKDYLISKQVPVIGQEGGQFFYYDSPMHFVVAAAVEPLMRATLFAAAQVTIAQGKNKLGVLTCSEAAYCEVAQTEHAVWGEKFGYEVVYKGRMSFTQPDFTAQCLEARNAGVHVIAGAMDGASYHRLAASCAKISYRPTYVAAGPQGEDNFKDDPDMDGSIIASNLLPWFLTDHPAIAAYRTAGDRYAPDTKQGVASVTGWTSAKALEAAARTLKPEMSPTSEAILAGLYALDGDDLGGLTYPLRFTAGQPDPEPACAWPVLADKGAWVSDGKMLCVPGQGP